MRSGGAGLPRIFGSWFANHLDTCEPNDLASLLVTRLHQLIPLEKTARSAAFQALTEAYHAIQRTPQLNGIARTYQPEDEDGDKLPPESTQVQIKANDVIARAAGFLTRSLDLAATREWANTTAFADLKVDDQILIEKAPVGFLLFLEKHLEALKTFVTKLPTLDPAEKWDWDADNGVYATKPVETTRTKKVKRTHVLVPPTPEHPGQAVPYDEDTIAGRWKTVRFSGALPPTRVAELVARITKLQDAVKVAREEANTVNVVEHEVGQPVYDYLFA